MNSDQERFTKETIDRHPPLSIHLENYGLGSSVCFGECRELMRLACIFYDLGAKDVQNEWDEHDLDLKRENDT